MKAKIFSAIVIAGGLGYLFIGLIGSHLPLREPPGSITPIEATAIILSTIFTIIGVVVTGYASIKWIIK